MKRGNNHLSFGIKIIFQIIALVSTIFLFVSLITFIKMSTSTKKTIEDTLLSRATDSSTAIERELTFRQDQIKYISSLPEIKSMNWNLQKPILLNQRDQWGFEAIYIIDLNGFVHYTDDSTKDMANDPYFEEIKQKQSFITEPWINEETHQAISTIIMPVKDDSSNIVGYICATLDLNNINNIVQNIQIGENGYSFLLSNDGKFISHKNMDLVFSYSKINDVINNSESKDSKINTLLSAVSNKSKGIEKIEIDNINSYIAYAPINIPNTNWSIVLVSDTNEVFSDINALKYYQIGLFILSLILCVVVSLFIKKQITSQLDILKSYSSELSNRNLSHTVTSKRKDEFGEVINSLNTSVNTLNNSMNKVKNTSEEILESNSEIDNMISNISSQLETAASTTEEISASIQECSATLDQITSMTEKVDDNTKLFSSNAADGLKLSNKIKEESEAMYLKTKKSKENIEEIYDKCSKNLKEAIKQTSIVENISTMSDSILSIAEQTNMLSLNASIEAARAGESGKGFAVVANEVKSLADQSSQAVTHIQKDIKLVVEAVTSLSNASTELLDFVENKILYDYDELINVSLNYQSAGTNINEMTTDFFNISDDIAKSVTQINNNIKELSQSLSAVSNSSQLIAENASSISVENEKIVLKADKNKTKASNLAELVNEFKLKEQSGF